MTAATTSSQAIENAEIIVIKVGSALVSDIENATLKQDWLDSLAEDVQRLHSNGKRIIIVSSGGIAMGRTALGISPLAPPSTIHLAQKQAASAIGQPHVFQGYQSAFTPHGIVIAQVLLTMSETENRRMHLNARETLNTLLNQNIVPIINENDTISTGEIRFGDNDRLAARVGQMIDADLIILLSTTDGLYTANPDLDAQAEHLPFIETITNDHLEMAGDALPGLSTGGMKSKLEAAQAATGAGITMIISDGTRKNPLKALKSSKNTLFLAEETPSSAKKKWIQSHLRPRGSVFIDNGALKALKNGKSLLPVGVTSIEGEFERGDIVMVLSQDKLKIAQGISAHSSEEARLVIGKNTQHIKTLQDYTGRDELIHRNDLALLIDSAA